MWSAYPEAPKSTGEAIGYDDRLPYALYKAMQAAGMKLQDHGTVLLSICPEDLEEALPLVGRFYRLGFNIEATTGTAASGSAAPAAAICARFVGVMTSLANVIPAASAMPPS